VLLLLPTGLLTRLVLAPRLLLVAATLLRGLLLARTLTPATRSLLARLSLARLTLTRLPLAGLPLAGLLAPTATTLLRGLTLLRGRWLLGRLLRGRTLSPPAALGRLLLAPPTLTRLSPLPARLAPRLPRTVRPLWRRRHNRSFEPTGRRCKLTVRRINTSFGSIRCPQSRHRYYASPGSAFVATAAAASGPSSSNTWNPVASRIGTPS
jgi:hypothetical protein